MSKKKSCGELVKKVLRIRLVANWPHSFKAQHKGMNTPLFVMDLGGTYNFFLTTRKLNP